MLLAVEMAEAGCPENLATNSRTHPSPYCPRESHARWFDSLTFLFRTAAPPLRCIGSAFFQFLTWLLGKMIVQKDPMIRRVRLRNSQPQRCVFVAQHGRGMSIAVSLSAC